MKSNLILEITFLFLCVFSVSPALPAKQSDTQLTTNKDKLLQLSKKEIKLGKINWGTIAKGELNLKNISDMELHIKAKTGCGCTKALLLKNKLSPGEDITLRIEFDPVKKGVTGRLRENVAIICNSKDERDITIVPIFAEVERLFLHRPSFINFGDVFIGNEDEQTAKIICAGLEKWDRKLQIEDVNIYGLKARQVTDINSVSIILKTSPEMHTGQFFEIINLTTSYQNQSYEIKLPVHGYIWDTTVYPFPRMASVGFVKPGESRVVGLVLKSFDQIPFVVSFASSQLIEVECTTLEPTNKESPNDLRIHLKIDFGQYPEGSFQEKIWLKLKKGKNIEQIPIVLKGYCLGNNKQSI